FVAIESGKVIGAGGGGMTGETVGEVFVLYLEPERRNEGIGSKILDAITIQQKEFGAKEQWVSVQKGIKRESRFMKQKAFLFNMKNKDMRTKKKRSSFRYDIIVKFDICSFTN